MSTPWFLTRWWQYPYIAMCLFWIADGIVLIVGGKWMYGVIILCAAVTVLSLVAMIRQAYSIGYSEGQTSVYDKWTAWEKTRMPERPEGVRINRADGEVIPVELAYAGCDDDGIDVWRISTPIDVLAGDSLHVDVMPGRCSIQVADRAEGDS